MFIKKKKNNIVYKLILQMNCEKVVENAPRGKTLSISKAKFDHLVEVKRYLQHFRIKKGEPLRIQV